MYKKIQHHLFSEQELTDLLKAWIAISLAFAIVLAGFSLTTQFVAAFILSAVTVGTGFLLHELSHRTIARRFGCWAEFRSFDTMLILAIVMSFFGFVFAAPGAVMISGPVGKRRNGIISAAGPATNIILAAIFLVLALLIKPEGMLKAITTYGFIINSWLALFNLIPIWNFDGTKILAWNKIVYGSMVAITLVFMLLQGILSF